MKLSKIEAIVEKQLAREMLAGNPNSFQELKRAMQKEPKRFDVTGWASGRLYSRWSDRPAGEPAMLVVDDLYEQRTFHVKATPQEGMSIGAPNPDR
jgi:hypothetical protein